MDKTDALLFIALLLMLAYTALMWEPATVTRWRVRIADTVLVLALSLGGWALGRLYGL
jgi:hypothetical protein